MFKTNSTRLVYKIVSREVKFLPSKVLAPTSVDDRIHAGVDPSQPGDNRGH